MQEQSQAVLRTHKAVVMCRFFRGSRTGSWEVRRLPCLVREYVRNACRLGCAVAATYPFC